MFKKKKPDTSDDLKEIKEHINSKERIIDQVDIPEIKKPKKPAKQYELKPPEPERQFLSQGRISQTIEELYEKIILGTGSKSNYEEMDVHIPTGFCDEKEVMLIRDLQDLLSGIDFIERRLQIALPKEFYGVIELKKIKDTLMRKMFFITLSSKSKSGFGIKAIGTQRQIISEDIYRSMQEEEEETALDKFKRIVSGGYKKFQQKKGGMPLIDREKRIW